MQKEVQSIHKNQEGVAKYWRKFNLKNQKAAAFSCLIGLNKAVRSIIRAGTKDDT